MGFYAVGRQILVGDLRNDWHVLLRSRAPFPMNPEVLEYRNPLPGKSGENQASASNSLANQTRHQLVAAIPIIADFKEADLAFHTRRIPILSFTSDHFARTYPPVRKTIAL